MLKSVYIAGSWSRRTELTGYAAELERRGITITSRWLREQGGKHASLATEAEVAAYAKHGQGDLADVAAGEATVYFTSPDPTVPVVGGGRHWECGYAYALGHPVILVGPREHVFHFLPDVTVLATFDELLRHLGLEATS